MNKTTSIHPDAVLEAIAATASHPTKRRNLEIIHQTCQEREKLGSKDFSLKSIGESVEARGGPKVKSLWNAQSADYRKLIEAWEAYAGGPKLRELAKASPAEAITKTIGDPATRILVEKLVRERNMLRNEVNILKSQTNLTIDRRPEASSKRSVTTAATGVTVEIQAGPRLNQLEREALEHAISEEHWRDEGWTEEKLGRVVIQVNGGRTRTIFKPGFVSAVRKLLSSG